MTRRRHNAKDRSRIFAAHNGICHICKGAIQTGEAWEIEHLVPLAISGDDTDANKAPAHVKCHKNKTAVDLGDIAKAKRREARHTGAVRPKGNIKSCGFGKKERAAKLDLTKRRQLFRSATE